MQIATSTVDAAAGRSTLYRLWRACGSVHPTRAMRLCMIFLGWYYETFLVIQTEHAAKCLLFELYFGLNRNKVANLALDLFQGISNVQ